MLRRGNRHVDPMRTGIDARLATLGVDLGAAHPRRLQKDCVVERAELDSGVARRLGRDVEPALPREVDDSGPPRRPSAAGRASA